MRQTTTHSYAAYRPCGCLTNAIIDDPNRAREIATQVASWERSGLRVERVLHSTVSANLVFCSHKAAKLERAG